MLDLVPWAAALERGTRRIFGFLQLDIARHSSLPGSDEAIQRTRGNLHAQVRSILHQHEAQELGWAGDGGAYLFLLDGERRVDNVVVGALQVLDAMRLFNSLSSLNHVGEPIHVRVSCHVGGATWDPDLSNLYGKAVNYFLKAEREIGFEDRIALTEEAFNDIVDADLRSMFFAHKTHSEYRLNGRSYERDIYLSMPIDSVVRQDYSLQNGNPPSVAEIARHLRGAKRIDLFMAGGDSFFRVFYDALKAVGQDLDPSLTVRVLLRRSSKASARSESQFRSLSAAFGITVETKFYDWDFMLRGYAFDDTFYLSYYLREGAILSGRYNPMVRITRYTSALEDFLITMFMKVFNAFFEDTPAEVDGREYVPEE